MVCVQIPFCCRYHQVQDTNCSLGRTRAIPNRAAQNCQIFSLTWIIVWNSVFSCSLGGCTGLYWVDLVDVLSWGCTAQPWGSWSIASLLCVSLGWLHMRMLFFELVLAQWIFIPALPFQFLVYGLQGILTQSYICQAELVCADTEAQILSLLPERVQP